MQFIISIFESIQCFSTFQFCGEFIPRIDTTDAPEFMTELFVRNCSFQVPHVPSIMRSNTEPLAVSRSKPCFRKYIKRVLPLRGRFDQNLSAAMANDHCPAPMLSNQNQMRLRERKCLKNQSGNFTFFKIVFLHFTYHFI